MAAQDHWLEGRDSMALRGPRHSPLCPAKWEALAPFFLGFVAPVGVWGATSLITGRLLAQSTLRPHLARSQVASGCVGGGSAGGWVGMLRNSRGGAGGAGPRPSTHTRGCLAPCRVSGCRVELHMSLPSCKMQSPSSAAGGVHTGCPARAPWSWPPEAAGLCAPHTPLSLGCSLCQCPSFSFRATFCPFLMSCLEGPILPLHLQE